MAIQFLFCPTGPNGSEISDDQFTEYSTSPYYKLTEISPAIFTAWRCMAKSVKLVDEVVYRYSNIIKSTHTYTGNHIRILDNVTTVFSDSRMLPEKAYNPTTPRFYSVYPYFYYKGTYSAVYENKSGPNTNYTENNYLFSLNYYSVDFFIHKDKCYHVTYIQYDYHLIDFSITATNISFKFTSFTTSTVSVKSTVDITAFFDS